MEISPRRRRLRHHQRPSTNNSHQEVPNGEWTLHPTKRGVTLSLYEWKELKKTIPLFEDRQPELRTMDNKVNAED